MQTYKKEQGQHNSCVAPATIHAGHPLTESVPLTTVREAFPDVIPASASLVACCEGEISFDKNNIRGSACNKATEVDQSGALNRDRDQAVSIIQYKQQAIWHLNVAFENSSTYDYITFRYFLHTLISAKRDQHTDPLERFSGIGSIKP